jgi:cyclophilin family peptidyl-prolyl cis-trans isomerase
MKTIKKSLFILAALSIALYSCNKDNEKDEPDPPNDKLIVNLGNDTAIIEGSTIVLNAGNLGATYLWSTGLTSQTIVVDTAGKYWVTAQMGNANGSDTIDVSMLTETFGVFIGNDTTVNEGESIVLDAGNPGASYFWSTGARTQIITIDTAGSYSVIVVKDNKYGCDTISIQTKYKTILVETDFGNFRIWLYKETPLHKINFLNLTDQDFYDSLLFHRVVFDFVIQGGDPEGTGYGGPGYEIPAEIIDTMHHRYGSVGAARQSDFYNPERKSNGSQFYIVCDPQGEPFLDTLYTVFGFVFSGMDAVFSISQVPVDDNDRPLSDVYMKNLVIELYTAKELKDNFGFTIP